MDKKNEKLKTYFRKNPNVALSNSVVAGGIGLAWADQITGKGLNKSARRRFREISVELASEGVLTYDGSTWRFDTKQRPQRTKLRNGAPTVLRGQGYSCRGILEIHLRGPKGSGKSMVAKILGNMLPLTGVDEVLITQEQS